MTVISLKLKTKIIALCIFCFIFSTLQVNASNINEDNFLIEAESKIKTAYLTLLEAEKNGANVTVLTDILNHGAELLSEAYFWNSLDNIENSTHFVQLCNNITDTIQIDVTELLEEAKKNNQASFFSNIIISISGTIIILLTSFFLWRFFKDRYFKKIEDLKPEVIFNES
jgi:hypothetical protein